jgi:hypothetical protein
MNDRYQQMSRRRLFFIAWGTLAASLLTGTFGAFFVFSAYHPSHRHLPLPLWVFVPEYVLCSALPAALLVALRRRKRFQPGPASRVDH